MVGELRLVVSRGNKNGANDYRNALNCVRLVTRLLPYFAEDQSDDLLEAVFWRNELPSKATPVEVLCQTSLS